MENILNKLNTLFEKQEKKKKCHLNARKTIYYLKLNILQFLKMYITY